MKRSLKALPLFFAAILILAVSIFKTAAVKYVFSQAPSPSPETPQVVKVNYDLPEPGLTPEDALWPVQALIDMGELTSEAYLENADMRLVAGEQMFDSGKVEKAVLVFEKAELYLRQSYESATMDELYTISLASLKHRQVLETILVRVPEDGRATVARILDIPKTVYLDSASDLVDAGLGAPEYPF